MTEEQLKTVIMNAHMAGQHNAGVDSSNYEALAYYESLVKNLTIPRVVFSEAEVCATCGQTFAKHSAVTRLCPDRFAHFKQT